MQKKFLNVSSDERGVSPVIGVILMVAITVILAAVIGTFVLELGQGAGEKAPDISVTFSDHDDPYNPPADGEWGEGMFTLNVQGLSDTIETQDVELVIIESDGNQHTFMGQNADGSNHADGTGHVNGMHLTINGDDQWTQTTEIETGDRIIIWDESGTLDATLSDDTDYTVQIRYIGGDEPKVITEATVRLK